MLSPLARDSLPLSRGPRVCYPELDTVIQLKKSLQDYVTQTSKHEISIAGRVAVPWLLRCVHRAAGCRELVSCTRPASPASWAHWPPKSPLSSKPWSLLSREQKREGYWSWWPVLQPGSLYQWLEEQVVGTRARVSPSRRN